MAHDHRRTITTQDRLLTLPISAVRYWHIRKNAPERAFEICANISKNEDILLAHYYDQEEAISVKEDMCAALRFPEAPEWNWPVPLAPQPAKEEFGK